MGQKIIYECDRCKSETENHKEWEHYTKGLWEKGFWVCKKCNNSLKKWLKSYS